jgi:hypothetical protein
MCDSNSVVECCGLWAWVKVNKTMSLSSSSQANKPQNPTRKPFMLKSANRIQQNVKKHIPDARQKIIAKTRSTVVDARSKITQKDARLKLNKVLQSNSSRVAKPKDLRGKLNSRARTSPIAPRPVGIIQRTVQSDLGYLGKS